MPDSKLELRDFNKICRMCLKEDGTLINIFFSDAAEVISEITNIRMKEGDFLPENICIPCMDTSAEFYKFKQLWEKNNLQLQSILALDNQVDSDLYKSESHAIILKEENKDNQEECSIRNKIKNNNVVDQTTNEDIIQLGLESNMNENQMSNGNVKVSLRFRPKCKIEIKRKYKDLIPLETYNKQKSFKYGAEPEFLDVDSFKDVPQDSDGNGGAQDDIYPEFENVENVDIKAETELDEVNSEGEMNKTLCEYCNTEFEEVQTHLEEYHPRVDSHYCYICSKVASSNYTTVKQLQTHLKYHKQIPKFQCEMCGKWFRYKHQRMVHMRLHTGERPAMCQICDRSFRDPRYLVTHLKSHTGEKPYECTICQKAFGHKFSLKVHMKSHSTEREHMCSICGKTFIYGHNLKIHLRQHTGEKPYTCNLCFTSFISGSVLRAHMLIHSDQKRFECKDCGKKFKRTGDLNVHMRSHTGEKPYACTLCSNRYKMCSHLTEHMKTHTGEKNYICEICSKSFYNNKSLQVHKNSHIGQKSYSCPDCDKSFVHHTSLCAHRRKHHKVQIG